MEKMPAVKDIKGGRIWSENFNTFEATVYVPETSLNAKVLNYGFIAPYLLVFTEEKMDEAAKVEFAREKGFEKIAADFASSVVFIDPVSENRWEDASDEIFADILTNSKIHQYYEDGVVVAHNRFTGNVDGYYIRGAIFRTCLFGFGKSADYIAEKCINHFEGTGLWGRADSAPVVCTLTGLNVVPKIEARDIPIASVGNSDEINKVIAAGCDYVYVSDKADYVNIFYGFAKQFRRMVGRLELDPNLEADGLKIEPGVITLNTSSDNNGDDKGTDVHEVGYVAFNNDSLFDNGPVPMMFAFHGGGDSAFYISYVSGWANVAHRNNFLLISIENHLNSTATEMVELIDKLKEKYNIDTERVYASGFSMGGCKTWDMIQEYPEVLAAAAPMDATFEVGLNSYGQPIKCELNTTTAVPVFYVGGDLTPLPELPFQAQKCFDRTEYMLKLNKCVKPYDVSFEAQDKWENRIWGINGDACGSVKDDKRGGVLTVQMFKSTDGRIITCFGSVDNQAHECREHTCEQAWNFMKNFRRKNGEIIGDYKGL